MLARSFVPLERDRHERNRHRVLQDIPPQDQDLRARTVSRSTVKPDQKPLLPFVGTENRLRVDRVKKRKKEKRERERKRNEFEDRNARARLGKSENSESLEKTQLVRTQQVNARGFRQSVGNAREGRTRRSIERYGIW